MPNINNTKTVLYSWGVLTNTIIGIGMFALPYSAMKVGVPAALFYLAALALVAAAIHIMFARVSLKTPDYKRLVGFCRIHLGRWAQYVAGATAIVGFLGSLLAYIIIGGRFLHEFLSPAIGAPEIFCCIAYAIAGAAFVYWGINIAAKIEFWGLALFFLILVILTTKGAPLVSGQNLFLFTGTASDFFFPYGPMLFAFWGTSSIPEIEEIMARNGSKKFFNKVIVWSLGTAFLAYAAFIVLVAGVSGAQTTQDALVGLQSVLGQKTSSMLFFFGFITSFTSFVITGIALRKILSYDLKINKKIAWAAVSFIPLLLFLSGLNDFMLLFSLIGGILLAIDGILIILMYKKIFPEKKFIAYPMLLLLGAGIIYEIIYNLI